MNLTNLKARLHVSEGNREYPYDDATGKRYARGVPVKGFLTIGVGHNLDAKPLSPRVIDMILEEDIQDAINDLERRHPWTKTLDPVRKSVLVDMCFNMGINKLSGFVNTLRMVQKGDYLGASKGMLQSLWASQVGKRAVELSRMMATGQE